jgi:phosphatidylglycerophosphatase A
MRVAADRLAVAIASVGYVGFAPVVPGTFGSLAGVVLFWVLRTTGVIWVDALSAALALVIGTWSAHATERALQLRDPGVVVIDEVVGMVITLSFLPVTVAGTILGFVLFRILDVLKPWPAANLERAPGGFGIMLDDVMAGIYANLGLRLAMAAQPAWFT